MLATAFAVGSCSRWPSLPSQEGRSWLVDLYLGRFENPQWLGGRIDTKMFLYWSARSCSSCSCLVRRAPRSHALDPSPGVLLYTGLQLLPRRVCSSSAHLYTYDVAERGLEARLNVRLLSVLLLCRPLVRRRSPESALASAPAPCGAFFPWALARGANLQKYTFKTQPERTSFGPLSQRALLDGDKRVLIGGFWGLSRHINYLGELLMATALALCLGYPSAVWPWLYPIYYLVLLLPRQIADDRRCAKYGAIWDEYRRVRPASCRGSTDGTRRAFRSRKTALFTELDSEYAEEGQN